MRCKNCGSENDENLYICQNCGSPLYDEEAEDINETDKTQVFDVQGDKSKSANDAPDKDGKKNNSTVIIIILCVILVAVIAGTVVAIVNSKKGNEEESSLTQVSTSQTTENETTAQTTTETTTETTTQTTTTTTTTTQAISFNVSLSCNDGGEVEGEGTYKRGENVSVIARPDDGYDFDGWYEGSKKVSSSDSYTFTVTKDVSLQAIFVIVNDDSGVEVIGEDQD